MHETNMNTEIVHFYELDTCILNRLRFVIDWIALKRIREDLLFHLQFIIYAQK